MLEKFNVVRVRFHIEDNRVLVIQGWKHGMGTEETLAVTLDGKELPVTVEKYDGMEVRQRYMVYDLGIEEEYFLYVNLPEDFGSQKELVLWAGGHPAHRCGCVGGRKKSICLWSRRRWKKGSVTLKDGRPASPRLRSGRMAQAERSWLVKYPGMNAGMWPKSTVRPMNSPMQDLRLSWSIMAFPAYAWNLQAGDAGAGQRFRW